MLIKYKGQLYKRIDEDYNRKFAEGVEQAKYTASRIYLSDNLIREADKIWYANPTLANKVKAHIKENHKLSDDLLKFFKDNKDSHTSLIR